MPPKRQAFSVAVGDSVFCHFRKQIFEAKVIDSDTSKKRYKIHYLGWNKRWDEWLDADSDRLLEFNEANRSKADLSQTEVPSPKKRSRPAEKETEPSPEEEAEPKEKVPKVVPKQRRASPKASPPPTSKPKPIRKPALKEAPSPVVPKYTAPPPRRAAAAAKARAAAEAKAAPPKVVSPRAPTSPPRRRTAVAATAAATAPVAILPTPTRTRKRHLPSPSPIRSPRERRSSTRGGPSPAKITRVAPPQRKPKAEVAEKEQAPVAESAPEDPPQPKRERPPQAPPAALKRSVSSPVKKAAEAKKAKADATAAAAKLAATGPQSTTAPTVLFSQPPLQRPVGERAPITIFPSQSPSGRPVLQLGGGYSLLSGAAGVQLQLRGGTLNLHRAPQLRVAAAAPSSSTQPTRQQIVIPASSQQAARTKKMYALAADGTPAQSDHSYGRGPGSVEAGEQPEGATIPRPRTTIVSINSVLAKQVADVSTRPVQLPQPQQQVRHLLNFSTARVVRQMSPTRSPMKVSSGMLSPPPSVYLAPDGSLVGGATMNANSEQFDAQLPKLASPQKQNEVFAQPSISFPPSTVSIRPSTSAFGAIKFPANIFEGDDSIDQDQD